MHITIIADPVDNQKAGIHKYTKNLIKALLKLDKKNKYSFIHPQKNNFFQGTKNYIVKSNKKIPGHESYRKFIKIPKLIKKINAKIVLETEHMGPFNLPKNIKRAVILYDLTPILFPQFHIKQSSIGHKLLMGKVIKNADLILSISKNTEDDAKKLYNPQAKMEVIYAGIDDPKTNPSPPQIPLPYILYLGTIEPRKNLTILIDAFNELKKEQKIPHKLVLAGGVGWKTKKILEKTKNNNDIILPGYIDEYTKASLYKHADIFVYPSIYEGFGLPPLEAMSYGTPVITSTGGSLKELFENHALTFEPHDKETLKKHIISLLKDQNLKEKIINKGIKHSKNFTWEATAKKTIEAFERILE